MATLSDIQRAVSILFPEAVPMECPDPSLQNSHSFFLQDGGGGTLWVEVVLVTFSREQITDYLAQAKQIEIHYHCPVTGILISQDYEPGVCELLSLVRIPIRFFRIQNSSSPSIVSSQEILEVTPFQINSSSKKLSSSKETQISPISSRGVWNRLTREELREFIQLELDFAHKRA